MMEPRLQDMEDENEFYMDSEVDEYSEEGEPEEDSGDEQ